MVRVEGLKRGAAAASCEEASRERRMKAIRLANEARGEESLVGVKG